MKIVRCCLKLQKSRGDDKETLPNSSMAKQWGILVVGKVRVGRGILIREYVVSSAKVRLKRL